MPGWLRVILGPIIGALVGSFAGWLQLRYGIILSLDDRNAMVSSAIAFGNIVGLVVKRALDAVFFNPGNASSPTLAKIEKAEVEQGAAIVQARR
jgi:hypothetical protein